MTERVSLNGDGIQGNSSSSYPSISADGRFVAFVSNANNLVFGDTNDVTDIFVVEVGVAAATYDLTVTKTGNGTVTSAPAGINCGSDCTESYTQGMNVTLTATPDPGSTFSGWSVACSGTGTCTVTMDAAKSVTATFAAETYTITATAGAGGSISPATAVVNYGGSQTFAITPNTGYHITDVLVNGVSVGVVTSFPFNNVTANQTISAQFAINTYTITASAGAGGSISPSTAVVNYGSSQTFTITPNTGYHILDVQVDGISVGVVTSYPFNNVTANQTISAQFAINTYTITATAGAGGSISPASAVVNYGGSQTFTITANTGYHITDVLVNGVSVGVVTNYPFNDVRANQTISAQFAINTYTITASAGAGGSINPSGPVIADYGTDAIFIMTPDAYYHLSDVKIDGISVGAITPYTLSDITANHAIEAVFEQDPPSQVAQTIVDIVTTLPSGSFSNPNNQNTLLNKLDAVIALINSGDFQTALDKLQNDILKKTDGCATTGQPDKNDWITDPDSQAQLYSAIIYLIEQLQDM